MGARRRRVLELPTLPSQGAVKARTFKAIGWTFLVAAFILGISFTPLAAIVPVFLGYICLRRAKKFVVESGKAMIEKDPRSPILYLRSFQDEEEDSSIVGQFNNIS